MILFNWLNSVDEEWASLTATSKQHYEAVQDLEKQYEAAANSVETCAEELARLEMELETARAVLEANRMTIEEFTAQNDRLIDSHERLVTSFRDGMAAIDQEEKSSMALIAKLGELSSKTELTATEQQQMSAIVGKLNQQMPELALSYDEATGALNRSVEGIRAMAQAQAEQQRQAAQHDAYAEAIMQQIELQEQLEKAIIQTQAAEENKHGRGWFGASKQSHKDLELFTAEQERLQAALDETNRIISETETAWADAAAAAEEAARAPVSYEDATSRAIQSVSEDLNSLIEKYDEAYASARNSLDGTFKLFEKVEEKAGLSSQAIIDAWQSQIDFFEQYNDNLQALQEFDLDPKFLARLSDGSQESAGQVKALMDEISNLSPEEAAARISEINDTFGALSEAKDTAAGTMAEIQTEFNTNLTEIEQRMNEAIDNMTMEDDAAAAARETISAYIEQIKSMTSEAGSAAESVARAATNALSGRGVSTVGIPGFAKGTTNAPDVFIAGEEGPELIVGAGGSTVFTAEETGRILADATREPNIPDLAPVNLSASDMNAQDMTPGRHISVSTDAPESMENSGTGETKFRVSEEKRITLDINGSGEFTLDGGVDEETVWEFMSSNLKPVLMNMLRHEIFEEGDRAYAF